MILCMVWYGSIFIYRRYPVNSCSFWWLIFWPHPGGNATSMALQPFPRKSVLISLVLVHAGYLFCNWHSLNTNYYGTTLDGMPRSFNSSQINACFVEIGVLGTRFIVSSEGLGLHNAPKGIRSRHLPHTRVALYHYATAPLIHTHTQMINYYRLSAMYNLIWYLASQETESCCCCLCDLSCCCCCRYSWRLRCSCCSCCMTISGDRLDVLRLRPGMPLLPTAGFSPGNLRKVTRRHSKYMRKSKNFILWNNLYF